MRTAIKTLSFKIFMFLDKFGIHILPKQYYTPLADYDWLKRNRPIWAKRVPMSGVHWDLREQLGWLETVCKPFYSEVAGLRAFQEIVDSRVGPGFGPIESQVLQCIIRSTCPNRIVEIGSGASTAVMLRAIDLNVREGKPRSQLTCIEPFPKSAFRQIEGITHIEEICQAIPDSVFAQLEPGDLLFIDSSHAVKLGSDVLSIYLQIIPNLKSGIYIHVHDIYFPYLYAPGALEDYFGWQETALLLALLTNNERLSVLACLSALSHDHSRELATLLTDYRPCSLIDGIRSPSSDAGHFPSSIWLKTC